MALGTLIYNKSLDISIRSSHVWVVSMNPEHLNSEARWEYSDRPTL